MNSITAIALKKKMDDKEDFQLIDVREADEHLEFNISGQLIPLSNIVQEIEKIATDKPVIIYCHKGPPGQSDRHTQPDSYSAAAGKISIY